MKAENSCFYKTSMNTIRDCVYGPPTDSYIIENLKTIDQPFDTIWALSEKAIVAGVRLGSAVLKIDKNETSGIIQIVLEGGADTYGGYVLDCGRYSDGFSYQQPVYPRESLFEIKFNSVSNTGTIIEIDFKDVRGGWEGAQAGPLNNDLNAKCVSTGEYEKSVLRALLQQVDIVRHEEETKRQKEEKRREEELKEQEREKREEEQMMANELDRQRREQEREMIEHERKINREKLLKEYLPKCNKEILSLSDFIVGNNPYADKGKCITIAGRSVQMTSGKSGLIEFAGGLAYIEFPKTFRGMLFYGLVKIKGIYTYQTVSGNHNNVPHFSVIKELTADEYRILAVF